LVGTSSFTINRKYRDPATLLGCPRLLITANNSDALRIREDLTPEDLTAIIRRVGYIQSDKRAADFLVSIGGRTTTEQWVAGDGIAKHVRWLQENRQVKPGPRYLVEGWNSDLSLDLITFAGFNGLVLTAIVYYLTDPNIPFDPRMPVGNGKVLVNARALLAKWKLLLGPDNKPPEDWKLANAFRSIANQQTRFRIDEGKTTKHIRCWDVNVDSLLRLADKHNIVDRSTLTEIINRPIAANQTKAQQPNPADNVVPFRGRV
jgi:hypothetical protein